MSDNEAITTRTVRSDSPYVLGSYIFGSALDLPKGFIGKVVGVSDHRMGGKVLWIEDSRKAGGPPVKLRPVVWSKQPLEMPWD